MLTSIALRELSPPTLVFLRTAPAVLVLAPFAFRGGEIGHVFACWRWVLVYTAVELAVPWLLLFHAQQHITSSLAGLVIASVPLIGAVIYHVAGLSDRLDGRRLVGLIIGFIGVAALLGIDVGDSRPVAMIEVLVVATCYATGPLIVVKRLACLPGVTVGAVSLALTAFLYSPSMLVSPPDVVSVQVAAAVATLAVVCTGVAFLVFFALIREVGPSRYTVVTYVTPLVAVLLGVTLLDESFTVGIAVSLPLILLGSMLGTAPSTTDKEPEHHRNSPSSAVEPPSARLP